MKAVVLHSESQSTLVHTSLFEVPIAMSHWSGTWLLLNPQLPGPQGALLKYPIVVLCHRGFMALNL